MQSPEKCPTFLRLSNLHHKPSSSKTIKTSQVFELNIGYFLEALTVNGLCLSWSMSHNMKTLLKLDCRYKCQNLPQIRHKEQNFPPAQSRGAVTFSGLWFSAPASYLKHARDIGLLEKFQIFTNTREPVSRCNIVQSPGE